MNGMGRMMKIQMGLAEPCGGKGVKDKEAPMVPDAPA